LYFTRGAERCFRATRSEQIAANGAAVGMSSAYTREHSTCCRGCGP
jgi:hypothetical protein